MDFANIPADEANAQARADALAATTILRTYEQLDSMYSKSDTGLADSTSLLDGSRCGDLPGRGADGDAEAPQRFHLLTRQHGLEA